jgi:exodeoxyribonuclease VII large subunit
VESYSLRELNDYIKRVIALNFTESVWIHAEVSQIKETRGQVYLELIEKTEGSNEILAQSSAVIWYKSNLFLKNKLGELAKDILQEGIVLKAKVRVDFHERYGLKLVIEDIDPSYTLGVLEMQRKEIIDRLKKEGLSNLNKQLLLPTVIQKIAVISSPQAAGLQDFYAQLQKNPYGYFFQTELFESSVQGRNLEREVVNALSRINDRKKEFDIIIVIRGGGSKIDLAGFDSYQVAKAIAKSSLPIITGIGHEIDQNIADLLAHTSLKTPTAVANWIIDHNLIFESSMIQYWQNIQQMASALLRENKLLLAQLEQSVQIIPKAMLTEKYNQLDYLQKMLHLSFQKSLQNINAKLDHVEKIIELAQPENTIRRGFAILELDNKIVSSVKQINKEDKLSIKLKDGRLESTVNNISS